MARQVCFQHYLLKIFHNKAPLSKYSGVYDIIYTLFLRFNFYNRYFYLYLQKNYFRSDEIGYNDHEQTTKNLLLI